MARPAGAVILRVAAVVALLALAAAGYVVAGLWRPLDPAAGPQVFEVRAGEPVGQVAERLAHARLIGVSPLLFTGYARLVGTDRAIKSGEYDVAASQAPVEILALLVSGRVKTYPVTLPEGLRLDEVAVRLEAAGITSAQAFLARARDPELARAHGLEADSFEGYAYPETYRFRRNTDPEQILARMLEEFRSRLSPEDERAIAESGRSLHQIVTLASIVEKETAVDAERPLVAAVFHNRLRRGMRLQSDPTVIYGVIQEQGSFDGDIRFRDLRRDNPYNTYTRGGLPPGPIASTSIASIRAVLAPADVPYLYFVSRNDGTHIFSKTLTEHTNAVNQYQRQRRPLDPS